MNHTMWKSMKNCAPKWCCKLCAFLLKVTCGFWKMWCVLFWFVTQLYRANYRTFHSHLFFVVTHGWICTCEKFKQCINRCKYHSLPKQINHRFSQDKSKHGTLLTVRTCRLVWWITGASVLRTTNGVPTTPSEPDVVKLPGTHRPERNHWPF